MPYYNYIHFRAVLAAGLVLAVAVALVAAGPLLVLSLVTGMAASRRQWFVVLVSFGQCRQCRPCASRRQCRPSVGPAVAVGRSAGGVGRPVGQPCRVRYKYVRICSGTERRKRAAVAGGGVPLYANTSLRCLLAKFFIFIFLFWDTESNP